jgi:methionine synthase II (cobalamin-independent)
MFIASRDKPLLTTITGSLPRPNCFQSSLNGRVFSTAMSDLIFREQYTDTLCTYVTDQARAGIDLLIDGDARFDMDVGGRAKVETPDQVAALIRKAIKHIEPERLILSTDCEFGRQGMSRVHAFYKMVSIVQGANLIKRELGFQEAPCLAADPKFSFL